MELKVMKKTNDDSLLISLRITSDDFTELINCESAYEMDTVTLAIKRLSDYREFIDIPMWKMLSSLYRICRILSKKERRHSRKVARAFYGRKGRMQEDKYWSDGDSYVQ